jgi:outer membrane protein
MSFICAAPREDHGVRIVGSKGAGPLSFLSAGSLSLKNSPTRWCLMRIKLKATVPNLAAIPLLVLLFTGRVLAQSAPASPDHPWRFPGEQQMKDDAKHFRQSRLTIEPDRIYSLAELVDFAERNNPETRVAWEGAKARGAALHIAQSELYPALAAVALSQVDREDELFGSTFVRQTVAAFGPAVQLDYTMFDFGARSGRIATARAELAAANFAFNDTHRKIIFQVADTYYRLLNAVGQVEADEASLLNAKTVQEAAENRLQNGLATLPDVLEARSSTAQAEYDLQSARGAEEIARGDLATTLGVAPTVSIRVQPLDELAAPEMHDDSVEPLLARALQQRPDLLQQLAEVKAAEGKVREARAAYYPSVKFGARAYGQPEYGWQQQLPPTQTTRLNGAAAVRIDWTIFDGGARKNNLLKAQASRNEAVAQAQATMDQIADEVWRSYSNVKTAMRQRQAATALLQAARQSYIAAVEAYRYGVRSLLDVTAAQRALAQARSTDVAARTAVLDTLADLAFRTGDLMRIGGSKDQP